MPKETYISNEVRVFGKNPSVSSTDWETHG